MAILFHSFQNPLPPRHADRLGHGLCPELAEYPVTDAFYGPYGSVDLAGYLLVGISLRA